MSEIDTRTTAFQPIMLDLAGQRAVTLPSQRLPRGAFEVVIKALEQYTKDAASKPQGRFTVVVQEAGDFKGLEQLLFIGIEPGKNNINIGRWKAAMLSAGAPSQVVEQNGVQIQAGNFVGKKAYIFNDPGDNDAAEGSNDRRDNRNFITPEEYVKIKTGSLKVPERSTAPAAAHAAPATVPGASQLPPATPAIPAAAAVANGTPAPAATSFQW